MRRTPSDKAVRPEKIPRPPNSFILYRSATAPSLTPPPLGTTRTQGEVSRLVGQLWRKETAEVKAEFERRAHVKKMEHEAKYPNYRYKPKSKAEREMERKPRYTRRAKNARDCGLELAHTSPALSPSVLSEPPSTVAFALKAQAPCQLPTNSHTIPQRYDLSLVDAADDLSQMTEQNYELEKALEAIFINPDGSFAFDQAQTSISLGLDMLHDRSWDAYTLDNLFDVPWDAEGASTENDNNCYHLPQSAVSAS
ncbi:hypothetical protein D9615_010243 [Tricholomella constricta]|uniref:HMG box domain-containing protein n=1 Tax=Tricholomella constricta TaxID=117010 RepID=A0A8H5GRM4_9AGAR|nr:hypothetical protein D9615_010243 [Tricholomella constricta]